MIQATVTKLAKGELVDICWIDWAYPFNIANITITLFNYYNIDSGIKVNSEYFVDYI